MNKINFQILITILTLVFIGCKDKKKDDDIDIVKEEMFPIYIGKDTFIKEINAYKLKPHKDKLIAINKNKTTAEKISSITDTLSKSYFNDLEINVSNIYSNDSIGIIADINLVEDSDYEGPGSLPSYQSWYDFFQGSHGGQNTTIMLKENILQRNYEGSWIDGIVFFYQGDSIGVWDHVNLHGVIKK